MANIYDKPDLSHERATLRESIWSIPPDAKELYFKLFISSVFVVLGAALLYFILDSRQERLIFSTRPHHPLVEVGKLGGSLVVLVAGLSLSVSQVYAYLRNRQRNRQ